MRDSIFFAMVADALNNHLRPAGYDIHVNTNQRVITFTDVIGRERKVFKITVEEPSEARAE